MGSDLYMNPPAPPEERARWDGDTIIIERIYRDRIYTQSKLGWHEIWRGTEEEYEKVKQLVGVRVPPKPGSDKDLYNKHRTKLSNAHAMAEQAARRVLSHAKEDLLARTPEHVFNDMVVAYTQRLYKDFKEDG